MKFSKTITIDFEDSFVQEIIGKRILNTAKLLNLGFNVFPHIEYGYPTRMLCKIIITGNEIDVENFTKFIYDAIEFTEDSFVTKG